MDDLIKFIHRDQIKILQAQLQNFGTKLSKHDSRLDALELEHQEIDVDELIVAAKAATAETINRWEESSLFPQSTTIEHFFAHNKRQMKLPKILGKDEEQQMFTLVVDPGIGKTTTLITLAKKLNTSDPSFPDGIEKWG